MKREVEKSSVKVARVFFRDYDNVAHEQCALEEVFSLSNFLANVVFSVREARKQ